MFNPAIVESSYKLRGNSLLAGCIELSNRPRARRPNVIICRNTGAGEVIGFIINARRIVVIVGQLPLWNFGAL